jgi:hypothetical protein
MLTSTLESLWQIEFGWSKKKKSLDNFAKFVGMEI